MLTLFSGRTKKYSRGAVGINTKNNRVRVSAKTVKGKMNPVDIVADNDGKWGTSQVMVSMAIAKIGATPPFFVEKGAGISDETYLAHLARNFSPAMSAIAAKKQIGHISLPTGRGY